MVSYLLFMILARWKFWKITLDNQKIENEIGKVGTFNYWIERDDWVLNILAIYIYSKIYNIKIINLINELRTSESIGSDIFADL